MRSEEQVLYPVECGRRFQGLDLEDIDSGPAERTIAQAPTRATSSTMPPLDVLMRIAPALKLAKWAPSFVGYRYEPDAPPASLASPTRL